VLVIPESASLSELDGAPITSGASATSGVAAVDFGCEVLLWTTRGSGFAGAGTLAAAGADIGTAEDGLAEEACG
jgi:hypothetical protein